VGVAVGLGVGEGVGVGVGVGIGVGVGELNGVGEGVELAFLTTTPLLQTNFFPDLIQVNFFPLEVFEIPCFEQIDPALGGVAE